MKSVKLLIVIIFIPIFGNCEKIEKWAKISWQKRIQTKPTSNAEIENWKEKLALNEAEIKELDKTIRKMVKKTKTAGGLSWKIAQAYMKVGNYELGIRYYNQALNENTEQTKNVEVIGSEVHFFESAIPYFDKTLLYLSPNEQLLFETGLAYANASKDRGWEKSRREVAIEIFNSLVKLNPGDSRHPYQLALLYLDSSMNSDWDGVAESYDDVSRGMKILESIIRKEPRNIPARFARANFLYRLGNASDAKNEYLSVKKLLETMKTEGVIGESLKDNQSYKNVLNNLKKLDSAGLPSNK